MKRRSRAHHRTVRAASRLKKKTPGFRARVTYVRKFSSGNEETQGSAGSPRGREALQTEGRDRDPRRAVVTIERQALGDVRP